MAISDPPFSLSVADGDPDDLPRTLRREREAREREARERQARERAATMPAGYHSFVPPFGDAPLLAYTRLAHEGGFHLDGYAAVRRWIGETEKSLGLPPAR